MFNDVATVILPTKRGIMLASLSALLSALVNATLGLDAPVCWLFFFCSIDVVIGTIAMIKASKWTSKRAYTGISKKAFMFVVVTLCNGMDAILGVDFIRTSCILAYSFHELGSIIENIERLGYGAVIPDIVRNAMQLIHDKEQKTSAALGIKKDDKSSD